MIDCHVHSKFSTDSQMTMEAACQKALESGLQGITFTDHLDYAYPDYEEDFIFDFTQYIKSIDEIKGTYGPRLKIFKGIEVGIQPHVMADTMKTVSSHAFDFVIASTHVVHGMDPYFGKFYEGKTLEEAYSIYLQEVLNTVAGYKEYDVVGHIGYVRRYGGYDDNTLRYSDFSDVIDSILKTVIHDGKGLEVNSSGYRSGLGSPMPDYDILKRYRELGGEILTLGSDAHRPEHIAMDFPIVKEKLLSAGFKYVAYFENRKPVFGRIE